MSAHSLATFRPCDLPVLLWLQQHPGTHMHRQRCHKSCHVLLRRNRQTAACCSYSSVGMPYSVNTNSSTGIQVSTTLGFVSMPVSGSHSQGFPRSRAKQLCCVTSAATMVFPMQPIRVESSSEHPPIPHQPVVNHEEEEEEQQQQHHLQQALVLPQAPQQSQHLQQPQHPFPNETHSTAAVDPSTLSSITARVRLLTNSAAARRHGDTTHTTLRVGVPAAALQACADAGVSTAASAVIWAQIKEKKVSRSREALSSLLAAFKRLADSYGESVVLEWLKKAPSVIRVEHEVSEDFSSSSSSIMVSLAVWTAPVRPASKSIAIIRICWHVHISTQHTVWQDAAEFTNIRTIHSAALVQLMLACVAGKCYWHRRAISLRELVLFAAQVSGRLAQLQQLLGPDASAADALALTKRCPQVLQVNSDLTAQRMQQLCSLLGRDQAEVRTTRSDTSWCSSSSRAQPHSGKAC